MYVANEGGLSERARWSVHGAVAGGSARPTSAVSWLVHQAFAREARSPTDDVRERFFASRRCTPRTPQVPVCVVGLCAALALEASGSLLPAIVAHAGRHLAVVLVAHVG